MEPVSDLQRIPGVGTVIAGELIHIGINSVADLKDQDPEALHERLIAVRGRHVDRCVLYVFRCAVYFATEKEHDPELLKWWNWKDRS